MRMIRDCIRDMEGYDLQEASRKGSQRMDLCEGRCSERVMELIRNAIASDISIYPEYGKFLGKLAKKLGVEPDNVLLTNGSDDAIRIIFQACIDPGDAVLLSAPTFGMYEIYAQMMQASVAKIPLEDDMAYDERWMKAFQDGLESRPKIAVICNPNNPTGGMLQLEQIEKLADAYPDTLFLVDEAYFEYCGVTALSLIGKGNVAVLRTFSKAYGLAGLRIGYMVSSKEMIDTARKISSPFPVSSISVIAAEAALDDQESLIVNAREAKDATRKLSKELGSLGFVTYPTSANFVLADIYPQNAWLFEALRDSGILIRPRQGIGPGFCRISPISSDQVNILMDALKELLVPQPDVILFDMDGVLVDVTESYLAAIQKTAEYFLEKEVTIDDIMRYKEKGGLNNDWDCTLAIVRDGGNNQAIDKIKEIFEMIYSRCMDRERLLIDKSFFESLRSKYRIGLVTGRPKKDALYASEKFSLGFDVMITLDDVEKGKPDPEGIRKALEKISPDQRSGGNAIYIGDTVDDVIAAAAAGIPCIGISRKKEVLMRAGARIVLDDVNQLKGFLEGNLGGNE